MATFDDSYSKLVAWLKILLPLAALAILSTLFLVSKSLDPTLSLPIAEDELKSLAQEPKIGNPAFSGVTENGSAVDFSALVAQPLDNGNIGIQAETLTGVFETPDGQMIDISANQGIFDSTRRSAALSGGVSLATSSGYFIQTDQIIADMETSTISTHGAISADGPLGHISAGKLLFRQKSSDNDRGSYELVFMHGVKLIYTPQQN